MSKSDNIEEFRKSWNKRYLETLTIIERNIGQLSVMKGFLSPEWATQILEFMKDFLNMIDDITRGFATLVETYSSHSLDQFNRLTEIQKQLAVDQEKWNKLNEIETRMKDNEQLTTTAFNRMEEWRKKYQQVLDEAEKDYGDKAGRATPIGE